MNNAELIKGIEKTVEGLNDILSTLKSEDTKTTPKTTEKATAKEEKKAEVKEEKKAGKASNVDVDKLNAMKYNEFKKYASDLGVKCTGTRDEILERILALTDGGADEQEETKAEDKKVVSMADKKKAKAKAKEVEPEEDEDTGSDDGEEEVDYKAQAKEIAEETSAEDIIEALSDVGVKATKRNYVAKLAEALEEGLISLDDEDEEEEESEEDSDEDAGSDELGEYRSDFDPTGINDPSDMTDERKSAIEELVSETLTQIDDGDITEDDITTFLEDNCTEEELEALGDDYTEEDLTAFHLEVLKRFVDDEGEIHEPADPYTIGETNMCCGHELKYVKKSKKFVCEICGTEYEE